LCFDRNDCVPDQERRSVAVQHDGKDDLGRWPRIGAALFFTAGSSVKGLTPSHVPGAKVCNALFLRRKAAGPIAR
jgi:hypothetical protein